MKKTKDEISKEREKVYQLVFVYILQHGFAPSYDELALSSGLAKSVVRLRLLELSASGRLIVASKRARTIVIPSTESVVLEQT